MFISNDNANGVMYNRDGEQFSKGMFLMLMTDNTVDHVMVNGRYNVRAIVRYVTLTQMGPWMMGTVRIGAHKYTLSGAYGADGLLMSVDHDTFMTGIELPDALYNAWANGGGHNSSGNETSSMRAWAQSHIAALYDVKRPCLHAYRTFSAIRNACTNAVSRDHNMSIRYGR